MISKNEISYKLNEFGKKVDTFINEHPFISEAIAFGVGISMGLICYNLGIEKGVRTAIPEAHKAGRKMGRHEAVSMVGHILRENDPDIFNAAGDILEKNGYIEPFKHA